MQIWYVDGSGALLGSYDGPNYSNPYAENGTAVQVPPADASQIWNGSAWVHPKPALKAFAADKRYRVETGGLVMGGASVATDRVAQQMISGASGLFDKDPTLLSVDWAIDPDTFVTLDKATVQQQGVLIGRHVQACFSAQKQIRALIEAGSITTIAEIEDWAGWPSNG